VEGPSALAEWLTVFGDGFPVVAAWHCIPAEPSRTATGHWSPNQRFEAGQFKSYLLGRRQGSFGGEQPE